MEEGRIPRRHASIHASMDSTRSKQLLSQWKNKNDNRKLSLQVMDGIRPASSSSPQRNMELHCSSEPSGMGLEVELRSGTHLPSVTGQEAELRAGAHIPVQYMKLAASSVPMASHNHMAHNGSTGMAGGARVSIQSRPGSSQLVHIPEEENPISKDQESESEDSIMDGGGSVREKWLRVAEKTTIPCRPLSAGGQPRLMQVNHSFSFCHFIKASDTLIMQTHTTNSMFRCRTSFLSNFYFHNVHIITQSLVGA